MILCCSCCSRSHSSLTFSSRWWWFSLPNERLHSSAARWFLLSADELSHSRMTGVWMGNSEGKALRRGEAEWRTSCFACQIYRSCQPWDGRCLWTAGCRWNDQNWPTFTTQKSQGGGVIHLSRAADPPEATKQRGVLCSIKQGSSYITNVTFVSLYLTLSTEIAQ